MADANMPPIEFLRECFSYNSETGEFRWRHRPDSHFVNEHVAKGWNSRLAGAKAFQMRLKDGYFGTEVAFEGRRYRLTAHRTAFAMLHGWWPEMVDHRNGTTGDTRGDNLRASDPLRNTWNRNRWKDRGGIPSGAHPSGNRWAARANHRGRKLYLGSFDTPQEAHDAYAAFIYKNRPDHTCTGAPGVFG